ncbi:peptidylprolyl isomerase [Oleiagrimonas soli]|uniref:Chaperone SurA n=1 Tax=Oleiagrimonas soli TaxID=1543381 RepID=A0A099CSY1_9GAMM|nr:peptidylprolyl isomerase [Oleiagrimonas soli]KGI77048.1 peptidylprolyl isomerase [Oleiagrimonas soli]MBB6185427.1 peptidyl-prolyl cis-trans isomerase SurA [Oleiagrimonas soli]
MKQIVTSFLFLLALIAAPLHAQLLPQAQSSQPQMIDRIVAVVNDGVILQSDLDQAVQTVMQQYAGHTDQLPPHQILERQVLQRLILMKLQVQKASEQGVRVSNDEVSQATQNVAQQNKMTVDQLRAAIAQQGGSFAQFQQQLAEQIMVQHLRDSVVRNNVSITDAEVDNMLKNPVYSGGEVHLAHIRVSMPSGGSASDLQAAENKAEAAIKAIQGGMDFNAAAIRYSDADDALKGGDLGWRGLDEIPPGFVDIVSKMKPGQITPPLRGPNGFQILKLIGRRAPQAKVVTEYHARQIIIKPSELVSEAQARKKINDLYHRIVDKHEDFAKLAKENSDDDTTANAGGNMDWFPSDAWGTAIQQQLDAMKDGQVSKPFEVQKGVWDIIQRLGVRQKDRTEEERRDQARQAIGNRKAQDAYENFLRQLRSTGYVNIRVPSLREPKSDSDNGST